MKYLGYYNGTYGPLEEMMIPMNDRVCYFGDGVYDATLARNGKIFALDAHLDRFYNSAGLLKMEVPYSREELAEILKSLLKEMDDSEIFVYWQMCIRDRPSILQFQTAHTWRSAVLQKVSDPPSRL